MEPTFMITMSIAAGAPMLNISFASGRSIGSGFSGNHRPDTTPRRIAITIAITEKICAATVPEAYYLGDRELYLRIFTGEPHEDYVRDFVARTRAGDLDDLLVYRKRLRRPLEEYQSNLSPQVRAARLLEG